MQLMLKAIIGLAVSLFFAVMAASAQAISVTYTAYIGANGINCGTSGYISPSTDTRNQGDVLTINFKNEQATALQVRGIPGGNFNVAGNVTVSKTFTTNETINYSIWYVVDETACQKATAVINVTPAPQSVSSSTPSSTPATGSSNQSNSSSNTQSQDKPATQTQTDNQPAQIAQTIKPNSSFPWWLLLAGLFVIALVYWLAARARHWWPYKSEPAPAQTEVTEIETKETNQPKT